MEKLEYLAKMLNRRTNGKDYENFVVNSIYAQIANPNLVPVTQQYVKNKNRLDSKKYYLLDLYFPQLNYGVEVDESHHLNDVHIVSDEIRADDIFKAVQCEEGRIVIYNKDKSLKTYDEICRQINREVDKIKKLIIKKEKELGHKLLWESNEDKKNKVFSRRIFDVTDGVDFKGVTEIYNQLGHDVKNLGRCFVWLNKAKAYKLWIPYLAVQLDDGTIKTKNGCENTLSEDKLTITEVGRGVEKNAEKTFDENWNENGIKRVVFMHMQNSFGVDEVRFLGVFAVCKKEIMKNGKVKTIYKRIAEKVNFDELMP